MWTQSSRGHVENLIRGLVVEVCVLVTNGTLERDTIVTLTSINDEAVGMQSVIALLAWRCGMCAILL